MTIDAIPDDLKTLQVDPTHAASVIASIMAALGAPNVSGPTNPGGTNPVDPMGGAPSVAPAVTDGNAEAFPIEGGSTANEPVSKPFGGGHPGIDFGVPVGTHLLAAINGTVTQAGNTDPGGYGNEVEITGPNGLVVRYGHLSTINVKLGDTVTPGQAIGNSGGAADDPNRGNATGPHLHFEVRQGGQAVDPAVLLAGGATILGGGSASSPTPLSPEALVGAALGNIAEALTGQTPTHPLTSQSTASGSAVSGQTTGADNDPNAVNAFLAATRQHESGGNYTIYNQSGQSDASGAYQFLSSTWKSEGGSTATAAQASPAEQDAIARKMATQLFDRYHSWRLVAIAWYGGPGVADQVVAGQNPGSPSGQGPYLAYGDTIQRMMSGGGG